MRTDPMTSLEHAEKRNKGWLSRDNCPPARVFVDGQEVCNVLAVNRRRGKVIVHEMPLKLNGRGEAITRALFGRVTIEII